VVVRHTVRTPGADSERCVGSWLTTLS
jgi:hypothetical protein